MTAMHFVLVHGAYHGAWCWDMLRTELEAKGHDTSAVDLPNADPGAGPGPEAHEVHRPDRRGLDRGSHPMPAVWAARVRTA